MRMVRRQRTRENLGLSLARTGQGGWRRTRRKRGIKKDKQRESFKQEHVLLCSNGKTIGKKIISL